ncbi:MAG: LptF/LptG family permease [Verrucomicrobiota bacterium]|jgi:lipopolysaccharide export system permease protein|nr:LptF/LptG family permease [Verrucomicrobiota bacterium]MDD8045960.1 LptF/LptG family permease [Verrucomicrobiota bacterium]MDD8049700.1 LptF/LptG family permease [Verrucomicrobiota bacterium]MDI9383162.1 LptF/LptG family permease [Verrucomicrobiota bacterium]
MRILNQYITQEFLKPLLVCALAFLIVFLVADLNDNLEDFTSNGVSGLRILWYYGLKLPQIMVQVAPLALLLATLFTISNMERYNELIAIRAAGIHILRTLTPLFGFGLICSFAVFLLYEFVCPDWLRQAEEFRRQLGSQEQPSKYISTEFHFENDAQGRLWTAKTFNRRDNILEDVIITERDPDRPNFIKRRMIAEKAVWRNNHWEFLDADIYQFNQFGRRPDLPKSLLDRSIWRATNLDETPLEFLLYLESRPEYMSARTMRSFLERHKNLSPQVIRNYEVEMHNRMAVPIGCLTAIIIGIPFSLRTGRKGPALAIASSIALFITLYMLSHIALYMGIRGIVPPILAAWLPNLAFLFLGLALLPTVR